MPRRTPGFVRDADQAAELAALLQDSADELERIDDGGVPMTRGQRARHDQTIARYRRWAAELTDTDDTDQPAPLQIRPARAHTEEATG